MPPLRRRLPPRAAVSVLLLAAALATGADPARAEERSIALKPSAGAALAAPLRSGKPPAPLSPVDTVAGGSRSAEDVLRREAGDRIFFAAGSAEIGARARTVLAAQAEWLRRHPGVRVTIEGHADDGGSEADNVALSATRADVARQRLIAEGVEASRIAVAARGRADRIAPCPGSQCQAQNRRAVTLVAGARGAGPVVGSAPPRGPGAEAQPSSRVPR